MKVDMSPTRKGFGQALCDTGVDERMVCLGADISDSITISDFYKGCPGRETRFLSMGIAEQSATGVAAGPGQGREAPGLRNLRGLRLGQEPGSAAHHGLLRRVLGVHRRRARRRLGRTGRGHPPGAGGALPDVRAAQHDRGRALRLRRDQARLGVRPLQHRRPQVPEVRAGGHADGHHLHDPWKFGEANIIRYRGEKDKFIDAFEHVLASKYKNENEDLTIIACGPQRARGDARCLHPQGGVRTRDPHREHAHREAAGHEDHNQGRPGDRRSIVTAEEHQVGGFGNWIAATIAQAKELFGKPVIMGMIGVLDRFGESGAPWELVKEFEVSAEHIAAKAKELSRLREAPEREGKARRGRRHRPRPCAPRRRPRLAKPAKRSAARPRRQGQDRKAQAGAEEKGCQEVGQAVVESPGRARKKAGRPRRCRWFRKRGLVGRSPRARRSRVRLIACAPSWAAERGRRRGCPGAGPESRRRARTGARRA